MLFLPKLFGRRYGRQKRRGFHAIWTMCQFDEFGKLVNAQQAHNAFHDEGEQYMLKAMFNEPSTTTLVDGAFTHAGLILADNDAGGAFANVAAGDFLYLSGGWVATGESVASGWYEVDSVTDDDNVVLTANPTGGVVNQTGGIACIAHLDLSTALDSTVEPRTSDLVDGGYDHTGHADGEKRLVDNDTGAAFSNVAAGDYIFLCGGYDTSSVVAGYYHVSSKDGAAPNDVVYLSTDPTGAAADVVHGISSPAIAHAMYPFTRRMLRIGLDTRSAIELTHTEAQAATYELAAATDTGYARQTLGPDLLANWTVAYESATERYIATSANVTFGPNSKGSAWTSARNSFLVMDDGNATPGNKVLISTATWDDAIALPDNQSLTLNVKFAFREED